MIAHNLTQKMRESLFPSKIIKINQTRVNSLVSWTGLFHFVLCYYKYGKTFKESKKFNNYALR